MLDDELEGVIKFKINFIPRLFSLEYLLKSLILGAYTRSSILYENAIALTSISSPKTILYNYINIKYV